MTTDGQPVRAYRVQVQVFAPGGEVVNQAAVSIPWATVRETSHQALLEYFAGMLGAMAGDVAAIVWDHAGGEGAT